MERLGPCRRSLPPSHPSPGGVGLSLKGRKGPMEVNNTSSGILNKNRRSHACFQFGKCSSSAGTFNRRLVVLERPRQAAASTLCPRQDCPFRIRPESDSQAAPRDRLELRSRRAKGNHPHKSPDHPVHQPGPPRCRGLRPPVQTPGWDCRAELDRGRGREIAGWGLGRVCLVWETPFATCRATWNLGVGTAWVSFQSTPLPPPRGAVQFPFFWTPWPLGTAVDVRVERNAVQLGLHLQRLSACPAARIKTAPRGCGAENSGKLHTDLDLDSDQSKILFLL